MKAEREDTEEIITFLGIKEIEEHYDNYSKKSPIYKIKFLDFRGYVYNKKGHALETFILTSRFHKDWNWLIAILEKIDVLTTEIPEDSNLIGDITSGLLDIQLEQTYEAAVELIKWYNSKPSV